MKRRKMSRRLNESQMHKLLELYMDYECLWNPSSNQYRDKAARQSAYRKICDRLNVDGVQVKHIPNKIKHLRIAYHQERRRVDNANRSNDCQYKPKVSWFSIADEFFKGLQPPPGPQVTENADENVDNNTPLQIPVEVEIASDFSDSSESNDENITKMVNDAIYGIPQPDAAPANPKGPPEQTLAEQTPITEEAISSALMRLSKIAENVTKHVSSPNDNQDDEFDYFGKYIATILRSLPRELSIFAKLHLQKIISDTQWRALANSHADCCSNVNNNNNNPEQPSEEPEAQSSN